MIGSLTGTITTNNRNPLIVNVNGIGYLVNVSPTFLSTVDHGKPTTLYIYTHVRDDCLDLYGFQSLEMVDLFMLLLSVSGVGPKTAILVTDKGLSAVSHAVAVSDVDFFTTIPRLGKKNAQKIIIELKNKLGSLTDLDLGGTLSGETQDLIDAMLSMGFARPEIIRAADKIDRTSLPIEEQIKQMLKILAKR